MKVTVNLVTWNGARYIKNCLASLFNQTYKDFELLIIDNNSTDETLELIREKYPHLKIVEHRENIGFAKAHNQAVHWTKSDYVLMLNQDVVLKSTFIENLVNFMDQQPDAGAVTGMIFKLQADQETNYIDSAGLKLFKNHRVIDLGQGEVDNGQHNAVSQVFGVSGAIPLYRRSALESVVEGNQFFDEDFFSYKEDVDLAYRLRWAGWNAYKMPLAVAYHDRTVSGVSEQVNRRDVSRNRKGKSKFATYHSYRNHFYFLIKNLPGTSLRYTFPVFWYELLKFFHVLLFERHNLKVIGEVWRNRKKFQQKRKTIIEKRKTQPKDIEGWFDKPTV